MNLLGGIDATANALNAEKIRMNIIAQNIANAHTTRDSNGEVYKRQQVAFESFLNQPTGIVSQNSQLHDVRVSGIHDDTSAGNKIFNPHHPHANSDVWLKCQMFNYQRKWSI